MGTLRGSRSDRSFQTILGALMSVQEYMGLRKGKTSWTNRK